MRPDIPQEEEIIFERIDAFEVGQAIKKLPPERDKNAIIVIPYDPFPLTASVYVNTPTTTRKVDFPLFDFHSEMSQVKDNFCIEINNEHSGTDSDDDILPPPLRSITPPPERRNSASPAQSSAAVLTSNAMPTSTPISIDIKQLAESVWYEVEEIEEDEEIENMAEINDPQLHHDASSVNSASKLALPETSEPTTRANSFSQNPDNQLRRSYPSFGYGSAQNKNNLAHDQMSDDEEDGFKRTDRTSVRY